MRDAARVRLVMTLVFGLIHGFGFASDLLEMRSAQPADWSSLLMGFNLGVEIAQVMVVMSAVLLAYLLVKVRLGGPAADPDRHRGLVPGRRGLVLVPGPHGRPRLAGRVRSRR